MACSCVHYLPTSDQECCAPERATSAPEQVLFGWVLIGPALAKIGSGLSESFPRCGLVVGLR
jgi:hypothetical protein